MATATQTPVELWNSLAAARSADDARTAESTFLAGLPVRLSIWGGFLAYGISSDKKWARWLGGTALAFTGLEYFAARRRSQLAAAASPAVVVSQEGTA